MTAAKRELCDFLTEWDGQLADGSHTHTHKQAHTLVQNSLTTHRVASRGLFTSFVH